MDFLCLGLGTIGIVLPILPTIPFYMATLFCFAKSSKKLHDWFIGTNLYKKHLDLYEQYPKSMAVMNRRMGKRVHPTDPALAAKHFKKEPEIK